MSLIEVGEGQEIEFKETFSVNTHTGKRKDDEIRYAALREIGGFLNTNDGVLIIGVSDDREITGLERDGYEQNDDKYSRQIHDLVKDTMGALAASNVEIKIETIGDQKVCRISCTKSPEPVYCDFKNKGEKAFVRYGSSTTEPPAKEWVRWVSTKFD